MASESWSFSDPAGSAVRSREGDLSDARDAEIILSNLSALSREGELLNKRRSAQLSELAALLLSPDETHLRDTVTDFSETHFMKSDRKDCSTEILLLCRELTRRKNAFLGLSHSADTDELFGTPPEVSQKASERVAYLHNRFTDEAFLKLTAHLQTPRAAYFTSFTDVSEEVYHGLCEFCILPVESSTSGKLLQFYKLIEKYELKIVAVCDVEDPNDDYTRYALLRHRFIAHPIAQRGSTEYFAEFHLTLDGSFSLSEILLAAEACGMHLFRTDSLPLPKHSDGYRFDCVFSFSLTSEQVLSDIEAFALYLAVTLPEYASIGIYPNLT